MSYTIDIEDFTQKLGHQGLSTRSIHDHIQRARYFQKECIPFNRQTVLAWINQAQSNKLKHNSINSYLKTLNKIAEIYGYQDLVIKRLKGNPTTKGILSDSEIEAFLSLEPKYEGKQKSHTKRFNMFTVFFSVLAYTGCRTHEAAQLTVNDIDLSAQTIRFNATKTNDIRICPIPDNLFPILEKYLKSLTGERLFGLDYSESWRKQFALRLRRLGIDRPGLTAYSFRHSFITRMLRNNVNLSLVGKLVGHRKSETTSRYTHLVLSDVAKALQSDPLNGGQPVISLKSLDERMDKLETKIDLILLKLGSGVILNDK